MSNLNEKKIIFGKHKYLLNALKKNINKYNSTKFSPDFDLPIYFSSYYNGAGLEYCRKLLGYKSNFLVSLINTLKDFLYCLNYTNLKVVNLSKIKSKKIILTWGQKKQFNEDGSFNDIYFNINSRKEKDLQWIVVYIDEELPKKINKNILLIKTINKKSIKFLILIKFFFSKLKFIFKDLNYFLFSISNHNFFSSQLLKIITKIITKDIKFLLLPYEAQPFQNRIIKYLNTKKIKSIGYIHSPPQALPINFIKKTNSPSDLLLNSKDQKRCFIKLGWKKNQLHLARSTRFLTNKKNFSNKIFLPISIKSFDIILNSLNVLLLNSNLNNKIFEIQNHPTTSRSLLHLRLIKEINNLLVRNKKKNNLNLIKYKFKNCSIFIGATGAIAEALERDIEVIHICEIPTMDMYNNFFWKNLIISRVSKNIFIYKMKKKSDMIMLGKKPKDLNFYFNNLSN